MKISRFLPVFVAANEQNETENDTVNLLISPRIIGGVESSGFPFLTAIWSSEGVHCGGALIHESWVLTAAHCVVGNADLFDDIENIEGDQFYDSLIPGHRIIAGLNRQSESTDDHVVQRAIRSAHCHPDYFEYSNKKLDNDICLLRLEGTITEDETDLFPNSFLHSSTHACLPQNPAAGERGIVAGWGWTDKAGADGKSDSLMQATLPHIPTSVCQEWYAESDLNINQNLHICYGHEEGGTDSCRGDSGGPIVRKSAVTGHWEVQGIVSFAIECAEARKPGVYANVHHYNSWIVDTINRVNPEANFTATCGSRTMSASFIIFLFALLRLFS